MHKYILARLDINQFPIYCENTRQWRLRLQRLPRDNSQIIVLTLPPKFAMEYLAFVIIFTLL